MLSWCTGTPMSGLLCIVSALIKFTDAACREYVELELGSKLRSDRHNALRNVPNVQSKNEPYKALEFGLEMEET
jgi:hypothetical protein